MSNSIEKISSEEHVLEIKKSDRDQKWLLQILKAGVPVESYRPLSVGEITEIIKKALS